MAAKTTLPPEVTTEFDARFEVHAGQQVVVIVKKVTTTPRTGRGLEYSKAVSRKEVTILPASHARRLVEAINDAFYFAADTHPDAGVSDESEPRFIVTLAKSDEPVNGERYFVWQQAEQVAQDLADANPGVRYFVRRSDTSDRFDSIISSFGSDR